MMPNDEQERERLTRLYAEMSDDELERIHRDIGNLTEFAQHALQLEFGRRSMSVELPPSATVAAEPMLLPDESGLVTIRQFRDLHEALLAQGTLNSAGIECHIADDNMVRLDWFISNLLGGVKLRVCVEDVDAARQILEQDIPNSFDAGEGGDYEQPCCPHCGSLDITFEEFNRGIGLATAYVVALPIQVGGSKWKCHSCQREWQDSGERS